MKKIRLHISQFIVQHDVVSVNLFDKNPLYTVTELVLIEEKLSRVDSNRQLIYQILPTAFPNLELLEVRVFNEEQKSNVPPMPENIQLIVSMDGKK